MWYESRSVVNRTVADDLMPLWRKSICNHQDDIGWSTFINSSPTYWVRYPAWVSNHIPYIVWDEINCPFPNVAEDWTLYWACDYLSMPGLKLIHISKRGSLSQEKPHLTVHHLKEICGSQAFLNLNRIHTPKVILKLFNRFWVSSNCFCRDLSVWNIRISSEIYFYTNVILVHMLGT